MSRQADNAAANPQHNRSDSAGRIRPDDSADSADSAAFKDIMSPLFSLSRAILSRLSQEMDSKTQGSAEANILPQEDESNPPPRPIGDMGAGSTSGAPAELPSLPTEQEIKDRKLLHAAVQGGNLDVIKLLGARVKTAGAWLETTGVTEQMTPLHIACKMKEKNPAVVKYILESAKEKKEELIQMKDMKKRMAIDYALDNHECVKLLLDPSAKQQARHREPLFFKTNEWHEAYNRPGMAETLKKVKKLVINLRLKRNDLELQQQKDPSAKRAYPVIILLEGESGTGKTVLANALTRFLWDVNLVNEPTPRSINVANLANKWQASELTQITEEAEQSRGRVLFIDEANLMATTHPKVGKGFFVAVSGDRFHDVIFVLAGYRRNPVENRDKPYESMEELFTIELNQGFRTRIYSTITLPVYSAVDLFDIWLTTLYQDEMMGQKFSLASETEGEDLRREWERENNVMFTQVVLDSLTAGRDPVGIHSAEWFDIAMRVLRMIMSQLALEDPGYARFVTETMWSSSVRANAWDRHMQGSEAAQDLEEMLSGSVGPAGKYTKLRAADFHLANESPFTSVDLLGTLNRTAGSVSRFRRRSAGESPPAHSLDCPIVMIVKELRVRYDNQTTWSDVLEKKKVFIDTLGRFMKAVTSTRSDLGKALIAQAEKYEIYKTQASLTA